ncbi:MAG TPA: efflux RND transporter periplasmic adaptor subunit [Candidatus Kapabacteria bacterium]|nr:efflux RND transporter periplasmic adaptor subunit [Candidatus Kapabacteria bacterium]
MAKRKNNKKGIIIGITIAILALAGIALVIFGRGEQAIAVTVEEVSKRTITQTVSAVGKIQPETEVKISSQTSGEVIFLGVKEGERVKAHQLLARINPDIVETQLEQVKASVEAAKIDIDARASEKERATNDFYRAKELFDKKFISKQEFDNYKASYDLAMSSYRAAMARYEQAKATLRQFERSLARTSIYSPIDGVVTSLSVELGEKVVGTEMMMGTEMMRISDLNVMNAVVDVDENDIVYLKLGDTAYVELDAIPDRKFKGVVLEISHSAKVSSLGTQNEVTNFEVKIRLLERDPRFRPGMSCNVEIQTETRANVLSVPLQSVTIRDLGMNSFDEDEAGPDEKQTQSKARPQQIVFILEGDKAKMRKVETGISDKGYIEIISGLSLGEKVISGSYQAVSKLLTDGVKVKVDTLFGKKPNKAGKK